MITGSPEEVLDGSAAGKAEIVNVEAMSRTAKRGTDLDDPGLTNKCQVST